MSSRSGQDSNSRRRRTREPYDDHSYSQRLPSLRTLNLQQDRDGTSLPPSRSVASRRAERIRNLDDSTRDDAYSTRGNTWEYSGPISRNRLSRASDVGLSTSRALEVHRETERAVEEASSRLAAHIERPTYAYLSSPRTSATRPLDHSENNPRGKRRRLDGDKHSPAKFYPPRYGRYGQVEAGQLQMEIVSCDGGMFPNKPDQPQHVVENVLKDDDSVYCTKGNRCNLVLRHQGGTTFSLSELIIKGPKAKGFSAPIREGMVFVSMGLDDAFTRTTQYQIQSAPSNPRTLHTALGGFSFADDHRMHPERSLSQLRSGLLHIEEDGTIVYATRDDAQRTARGATYMPPEFNTSHPNANITIECSEDHEEEQSSRRPGRFQSRIAGIPLTGDSDEEEEEEEEEDDYDYDVDPFNNFSFDGWPNGYNQGTDAPSDPLADAAYENQPPHLTSEGGTRPLDGTLSTPHARFLIEKKKSTCTIRFNPPISGRFILLKMWNLQNGSKGNIDIQSIITRGFAGPRYFPSIQLR